METKRNQLFYKIISTSMSPSLNVGDIVIKGKKAPKEIKTGEDGDILILEGPQYFYENGIDPIMWNNLPEDFPIIHRAINKMKKGDLWYFQTKGDNNWAPDGSLIIKEKTKKGFIAEFNPNKSIYIPESKVLGVVIKRIPYNGNEKLLQKSSDFFFNIKLFERMEVKVFFKNQGQ